MLEIIKEIFAACLPIIEKEAIPAIEETVFTYYKPRVIEWLNTQIGKVTDDIAKEKITLLQATIGHGELKDEAKLVGYNLELKGLQWALEQVTAYEVPTA